MPKTSVFLFFLLLPLLHLFAQQTMHIAQGTPLRFSGDVAVVLNDTKLVNNAGITQANGQVAVKFSGEQNSDIAGSGETFLQQVSVAKENGMAVALKQNIAVGKSLVFSSGLLNLQDAIVDLGADGVLLNESENSRAYTNGSGYLQSSPDLTNITVADPGNLGLFLSASSSLGKLVVKRGHAIAYNGIQNSISRYYEVETVSTQPNIQYRFQYLNAEVNAQQKQALSVWHWQNNAVWINEGIEANDAANNLLQKSTALQTAKFTFFPSPETVAVWPNPVVSVATVSINTLQKAEATLLLLDAKGALVQQSRASLANGTNQLQVDMHALSAGKYLLQIRWNETTKAISLVKQ